MIITSFIYLNRFALLLLAICFLEGRIRAVHATSVVQASLVVQKLETTFII